MIQFVTDNYATDSKQSKHMRGHFGENKKTIETMISLAGEMFHVQERRGDTGAGISYLCCDYNNMDPPTHPRAHVLITNFEL